MATPRDNRNPRVMNPGPSRQSSYNTPVHTGHRRRHPRLTLYRILVVGLTAGFGLSKAKLSYQGYSTAPNTLDWLYGVVAFLILYWLGIYERHAKHNMPWMFEVDYLVVFWNYLTRQPQNQAPRYPD